MILLCKYLFLFNGTIVFSQTFSCMHMRRRFFASCECACVYVTTSVRCLHITVYYCEIFSYIHTSPHFSLVLQSPDLGCHSQRRVVSFCAAAVAATAVSTVTRLVLVRRNVAAQSMQSYAHSHFRTFPQYSLIADHPIELVASAAIIAGYSIKVNCVWSVQN